MIASGIEGGLMQAQVLALAVFLAGSVSLVAQDAGQCKLRFTQTALDRVYRVGKAIDIEYSIENIGDRPCFVSKILPLGRGYNAGIDVRVIDEGGAELKPFVYSDGEIVFSKELPSDKLLAVFWIELQPGYRYGTIRPLNVNVKAPGKYTLRTIYFDHLFRRLAPQQRDTLQHQSGLLDTEVDANELKIEVR